MSCGRSTAKRFRPELTTRENIYWVTSRMTEFMADDDLAINRVNPYTATNTFGVSSNGGRYPEMQWKAPSAAAGADDTGMASWDDHEEYTDHFARPQSGGIYLKTGGVDPALSFMYPARKVQYDDGATSWSREIVWKNAENYTNIQPFGEMAEQSLFPVWIMRVLLAIIFIIRHLFKI